MVAFLFVTTNNESGKDYFVFQRGSKPTFQASRLYN